MTSTEFADLLVGHTLIPCASDAVYKSTNKYGMYGGRSATDPIYGRVRWELAEPVTRRFITVPAFFTRMVTPAGDFWRLQIGPAPVMMHAIRYAFYVIGSGESSEWHVTPELQDDHRLAIFERDHDVEAEEGTAFTFNFRLVPKGPYDQWISKEARALHNLRQAMIGKTIMEINYDTFNVEFVLKDGAGEESRVKIQSDYLPGED